jgi:hypothetical protein
LQRQRRHYSLLMVASSELIAPVAELGYARGDRHVFLIEALQAQLEVLIYLCVMAVVFVQVNLTAAII